MQDLRAQIGQVLVVGFEGSAVSGHHLRLLRRLQPGGVILFARNISGARHTHRLLRACQDAVSSPLLRCVDLEGGTVDRLKQAVAPAPSAAAVAATGQHSLFREHGRLLGQEARALGFNTDFAPVLDIGFNASRAVMGSRTTGREAAQVVAYAREFLRGLRAARVLGCGKHFPGLGSAGQDSHVRLPVVRKSWARLWEEDLVPYRKLRRELPMIMVAHASYPAFASGRTPASLSHRWLGAVLRKRIGFQGLVVSDDLEMGGAQAAGPIEHLAVESIRAGADMLLVCRREDLVARAYEALVREAERNPRFALRVSDAIERILTFKRKARVRLGMASEPTQTRIARLRTAMRKFHKQVAKASAAR